MRLRALNRVATAELKDYFAFGRWGEYRGILQGNLTGSCTEAVFSRLISSPCRNITRVYYKKKSMVLVYTLFLSMNQNYKRSRRPVTQCARDEEQSSQLCA